MEREESIDSYCTTEDEGRNKINLYNENKIIFQHWWKKNSNQIQKS